MQKKKPQRRYKYAGEITRKNKHYTVWKSKDGHFKTLEFTVPKRKKHA